MKDISNCYMKMKNRFINFFKDKSFGKKEPLREAGGQTKKKKNLGKGHMKKGSAKGQKSMVIDGLSL